MSTAFRQSAPTPKMTRFCNPANTGQLTSKIPLSIEFANDFNQTTSFGVGADIQGGRHALPLHRCTIHMCKLLSRCGSQGPACRYRGLPRGQALESAWPFLFHRQPSARPFIADEAPLRNAARGAREVPMLMQPALPGGTSQACNSTDASILRINVGRRHGAGRAVASGGTG